MCLYGNIVSCLKAFDESRRDDTKSLEIFNLTFINNFYLNSMGFDELFKVKEQVLCFFSNFYSLAVFSTKSNTFCFRSYHITE